MGIMVWYVPYLLEVMQDLYHQPHTDTPPPSKNKHETPAQRQDTAARCIEGEGVGIGSSKWSRVYSLAFSVRFNHSFPRAQSFRARSSGVEDTRSCDAKVPNPQTPYLHPQIGLEACSP